MDEELQAIADALLDVDKRLQAFEQNSAPAPRTGTLAYLSGRWKLRDGWMYGQ